MIKAGVIGMGIGEKHAQAYDSHPKAILKAICDFDPNKMQSINNRFPNVSSAYEDQSILDDNNIDLVSIASYDNYHCDQIVKAFNSGKHVMAEKPICLNRNEMEKIIDAQERNNNVKISANHVLRSNSRFNKLKNEVMKGKFGDIFFIEGDYYWGRSKKLYEWRANMDYYSIILGAAIHMIDLIMWIIGDKPIAVQAMGNNIANKNTKLKYNSFSVILLKFESGIVAKLTGNGPCVHPHYHGLKIFGTKRTAIHDLSGAYYLESTTETSEQLPILEPYPEKESRQKVIHSFIDSILNPEALPIVPQQDVYNVMSVCFAAEDAIMTGKQIDINYLG